MSEILGNTLKDKQEELIKILGFDYDTFRNTANFEQGGADSFSKLTPKEAKLSVMKILQLSRFDLLEKRCREIYKQLFEKGTRLKNQIEFIDTNTDWKEEDIEPLIRKEAQLVEQSRSIEIQLKEIENQRDLYYQVENLQKTIQGFETLDMCPTCKQRVGENHKDNILKQNREVLETLKIGLNYSIINKENIIRTSYNALIAEIAEIRNSIKNTNDKKKRLNEILADKDKYAKELEIVKSELNIYKTLIEAFGKNGIPAFIIDNTAPEIERISNDLLKELNVGFQIRIDTRKTLKSGETSDTLDINIINGKFIRPYYLFSGGERFLIDLALRVALSVILLRRKGCNNSTLIIDEGMGSLDGVNSLKVVELVKLVQEKYGFQKILMVTHVLNIQDLIENKIEIEKKLTPEEHSIVLSYNKIEEE